jgi:ferredoxin
MLRRPALHIMDGIVAMQGRGPTAGAPFEAKKLLMSTDPLALDAVACAMLGLDIEELPIFASARERGLGAWRREDIRLLGGFESPPRLRDFDVPKALRVGALAGKAFGGIIGFLKRRPQIDLAACKDCGVCVESCPVNAIDRLTKNIDYAKCIECLCCHELCMHKALELRRANWLMARLSRSSAAAL